MSTKTKELVNEVNAKDASTLKIVKGEETTKNEKDFALNAMIEKFKPKQLTAEERIIRISQFEAVSKRFKLLKQKSDELKMWNAGNDKSNATINLKNSSGFEFAVSNSFVIQKVLNVMQQELDILLGETEIEILTFEI